MKKMSKSGSGGGGGDSWLNTYADMVTLLLTFFVLLFSTASIDAEKWQILVKAFSSNDGDTSQFVLAPSEEGDKIVDVGADSMPQAAESDMPVDFNQLYEYIKKYVEENNLSGSVTLEKGANSVYIRFQDNIFFDPNRSALKKEALPLLDFMGNCFLAVEDQIMSIRINGHTATVPGSTKQPGFDRTLSSERANRVLLYFESTKQFDPKKLISIGYGRNYPVADNSTEEGRKKNRRVEIMILSNNFDMSNENDLFKTMNGQMDANLFEDESSPAEALIPGTSDGSQPTTAKPEVSSTAETPQQSPDGALQKEIIKGISPYDN